MEKMPSVTVTMSHADVETTCRQNLHDVGYLEALSAIGEIASSSLPFDRILDRILNVTVTALEMEAGEICLCDTSRQEVRLVRHHGLIEGAFLERTRFAVGEGIPGLVVQTGEPVVIADLAEEPRFLRHGVVAAGFQTFAAFPLLVRGEVIGSIDVATQRARPFTTTDRYLLSTIGAVVGVVAADTCRYEELRAAIERLTARIAQLQYAQDQSTDGVSRDCDHVLTTLQLLGVCAWN